MQEFEIFLSAGSLAMDAFAASLGIGACLPSAGARLSSCAGPAFRMAAACGSRSSAATGSGASNSSRIASGRVSGSTGNVPGNGGTSCGDPGPLTGGSGGGVFTFDMEVASLADYRPSALALSAS